MNGNASAELRAGFPRRATASARTDRRRASRRDPEHRSVATCIQLLRRRADALPQRRRGAPAPVDEAGRDPEPERARRSRQSRQRQVWASGRRLRSAERDRLDHRALRRGRRVVHGPRRRRVGLSAGAGRGDLRRRRWPRQRAPLVLAPECRERGAGGDDRDPHHGGGTSRRSGRGRRRCGRGSPPAARPSRGGAGDRSRSSHAVTAGVRGNRDRDDA